MSRLWVCVGGPVVGRQRPPGASEVGSACASEQRRGAGA